MVMVISLLVVSTPITRIFMKSLGDEVFHGDIYGLEDYKWKKVLRLGTL